MLDLIFVALWQAAAGDPSPTQPVNAQPAQTQMQAAQPDEATAVAAERRRCRARQVTGTRLQTLVLCRTHGNSLQDQDTRDALHDLQRPAPTR